MNTHTSTNRVRLDDVLDRLGQRRKPLPTDDEIHGCRGELEWGMNALRDRSDTREDVDLFDAQDVLLDACCDSYTRGRGDAAERLWFWKSMAIVVWPAAVLLYFLTRR